MPPKTVAVVCAVSLTIGWLLASIVTPPVARLQSLPERPATGESAVATADPYTEILTLKQRAAPAPPQPRRNPFVFGDREARPSSQPRPVSTEVQLPPPEPVRPSYQLSGIGISETAEGVECTAVISDGITVHLLKAGDTIGSFAVTEVTDSSVILTDTTGARLVLRLR